jgi:hypothetical protein
MTNGKAFGSNGDIGKRLLTPEEAAAYLGLKVDTIYKKAGCASFLRSRLAERCGST